MSTRFWKRQRRRVERKLRILTHRDIRHRVGNETVVLPPEHYLAYYQEDLPFYDRYFLEFLKRYSAAGAELCVIDIGANVGDTALAVLSAAPNARVISVEGSPYFLKYLRLNTRQHTGVQIVDGFVTHKSGNWSLASDGSTGYLLEGAAGEAAPVDGVKYYSPSDILGLASNSPRCIWKTDTDGYDIPILLGWFDEIVEACEVVWIEFDPLGNLSDPGDVDALLQRISLLPRDVVVFDNFGHRLLQVPAKNVVGIVQQLNNWLAIQESARSRLIGYFDLWILPPALADLLSSTSSVIPGRWSPPS